MPIQYSCVVCRTTVLCSYQTAPGPFEKLLTSRLPEIASYKRGKKPLQAGSYVYYTITEDDITFLCTVTADVTVMQSYAFLIQVKTLFWQAGFGSRDLLSAEPHELDAEFVAVLDTQMELYSSDTLQAEDEVIPSDNESTGSVTMELAALVDKFQDIDVDDVQKDEANVEVKVNLIKNKVIEGRIKEVGARSQKTEQLECFVEKNSKEILAFRENAKRANWLFRKKNRRMSILLCIIISLAVVVVTVIAVLLGIGILR
ncbi:uncharacterized protein LOC110443202 [Mizuhopecten yessoensis]|uniref:Vesicle-associated membrane protein 7 n=1 Tax=Mizuhopecten yessoensis TaxID=6573 RepID=A0A210PFL2_MIZYE|nr:uncharacterized protein LOC110443202 [Mizuhopecten yessoensis]OWF35236.1 Vesicle-associated membrane protein 7 [Mizuhopecten yessoensis]